MNLDITHLEITARGRTVKATGNLLSRQRLQFVFVICTYVKTSGEARHGRDKKKKKRKLIISIMFYQFSLDRSRLPDTFFTNWTDSKFSRGMMKQYELKAILTLNRSIYENSWENACMLCFFSRVWLFVTLLTITCQAPLSVGFSRQEYWSASPWPPPGVLPDAGIEPISLKSPVFPALQMASLLTEPPGKSLEKVGMCEFSSISPLSNQEKKDKVLTRYLGNQRR